MPVQNPTRHERPESWQPSLTHQESAAAPRFHAYTESHLDQIPHLARLSAAARFDMRVVAIVLPFRVNQYVLDQLIDWDNIPADPIFQLTFPQVGMLQIA